MMSGNKMSDILMNVRGNCPNCQTTLTFMEAARFAKENDIGEDVVMCPNCRKVYKVNLTLNEMNFVEEVNTINGHEGLNDNSINQGVNNNMNETQDTVAVGKNYQQIPNEQISNQVQQSNYHECSTGYK